MTKKLIEVEELKRKLYDVRDKLDPYDSSEGLVVKGMNDVDDIIDQMAEMGESEALDRAQKEIELAIAAEKRSAEGTDDWKYGVGCYESAMKAYEALLDDNHSGMSIQVTKSILNRLIDGKCLTPIEDTDDVWNDITEHVGETKNMKEYQCKRMSSLFKMVDKDGNATYTDLDRVSCVDISNPGMAKRDGLATRLIDKLFPITMPYLPPARSYKVFMEDLFLDNDGYYYAIAYLYILLPNGRKIDLNHCFKEDERGELVSIEKEEFEERKKQAKKE